MQGIILVDCKETARPQRFKTTQLLSLIEGKAFIAHYLDFLENCGFQKVVLASNISHSVLKNTFSNQYQTLELTFMHCENFMSSGRAIIEALALLDRSQAVFIMTDLYLTKLNFSALWSYHQIHKRVLTIVLKTFLTQTALVIKEDTLIGIQENRQNDKRLSEAGVYLVEPKLFNEFDLPKEFSFHQDFLRKHLVLLKPKVWVGDGV